MSYVMRAYVFSIMTILTGYWYVARIWVPNNIGTDELFLHAFVFLIFAWFAIEAWREIAYTLSKNRYCTCGHLRGRHSNDKHCLQEVQSQYPINAKVKDWKACDCRRFNHDWSIVK